MTEIDVDLEQIDYLNKSAGLTALQRLEAIEKYLTAGQVFPESLLQDLEELNFPEKD